MVNLQRKSLERNIVVTPAARPSSVQKILKLTNGSILVRNHSNATAVIRRFQTNRFLIAISKRTTNALPSVRSPVQPVAKPFTTGHL